VESQESASLTSPQIPSAGTRTGVLQQNRREADITDRLEYVAVGPQAPTLVGFDDSPIALATNTVGA
jgi:hypothetical protein